MTQEEKELLIKDLCARLPYGVVYHRNDGANIKLNAIDVERGLLNYTDDIDERECKPYLCPMESMTEEEKKKERKLWNIVTTTRNDLHYLYTDFLVSHHLDYRGLIPMGLALEAKEGMYNIK